jgi:hypothetical protein
MSNAELKKRLRLSCLIILVAGLCGAMLIYVLAEDIPDDSLGYPAQCTSSRWRSIGRGCKTAGLERFIDLCQTR